MSNRGWTEFGREEEAKRGGGGGEKDEPRSYSTVCNVNSSRSKSLTNFASGVCCSSYSCTKGASCSSVSWTGQGTDESEEPTYIPQQTNPVGCFTPAQHLLQKAVHRLLMKVAEQRISVRNDNGLVNR